MGRSKRHQDYDIIAQIQTGESIGPYASMTDLESGPRQSSGLDLDSEFVITHLPVGLGYETEEVG